MSKKLIIPEYLIFNDKFSIFIEFPTRLTDGQVSKFPNI